MFCTHRIISKAIVFYASGRSFSSNNILLKYRNIDFSKITKKSQKFMNKTGSESKRKKRLVFTSVLPSSQDPILKKSSVSAGSRRRAQHLGAVFQENITFLLGSQQVCPELTELGLEILNVKMSPDLGVLNVYWLGTGGPRDDDLEQYLDTASYSLRDALSKLRLMGRIPSIQFIKDTSQSRLQQVEQLLAVADMGENFEPTDIGKDLKSDPTVSNPQLKQNLQEKLQTAALRMSQTDVSFNNCQAGPGGSVEFVNSAETGSPPNVRSEIGNEQVFFDIAKSGISSSTDGCLDVNELEDELKDLILRSDVYEVDQASLMLQVVHSKRKMADRSYRGQVQEINENSSSTELNWKTMKRDVTQILAKRHKRQLKPVQSGRKNSLNVNDINRDDQRGTMEENRDVNEDDDYFEYDEYDRHR